MRRRGVRFAVLLATSVLALGGLLGLGAPARAATDHAVIALPAEGMQFLGYYAAEDLGFFKEEDIEVKHLVLPGVASPNAVVSGSVEFAFGSGASLTRAAAHGQRMLAIAQMNNLPSWDIVVNKDIATAAHFDPKAPLAVRANILQGKKMGTGGINSLDHAYLRIVAKLGGDPDTMTIAPMAGPDMLAAFARHAIDGFVSAPPWAQQVEDDGTGVAIVIGPNKEPPSIVPIGSSLLLTRPQVCEERLSLCVKMGHAMVLASRAVHERQADVLALLQRRFSKIKPSVVALSLKSLATVMPMVPAVNPESLKKGDQINVDAGFMKPADMLKSYDGLSTEEFVK